MPTNDEIKKKYPIHDSAKLTFSGEYDTALNEARSDTTSKHIGAIWNWWNAKPQKRKNDKTTRIITRTDIEELVKLIE